MRMRWSRYSLIFSTTPLNMRLNTAISSSGDLEDEWVEIQVKDNGLEYRKNIAWLFERFYRVDKGRSKDMGGTGLGLSIVQHLANAMGGGVGMRPNQPHGSCFWIRLERSLPKAGTTRM